MANKRTMPLTEEQYHQILRAMETGCSWFRPNPRIREALICEANLGIRIEDVLTLKLSDFYISAGKPKIDIIEKKTKKRRDFPVHDKYFERISEYCKKNQKAKNDIIFDIKERQVQQYLKKVCDYLGYENISTHSFRKYFGTCIYNQNYNIVLVQKLYQHSSPVVTMRYIGITDRDIENAINNHVQL